MVTRMVRSAAAISVCAAMLLCSPALAQRNPLIATGQQQYDELRYEEALQTLSAALVRSGNSPEEQATMYRLLAFTYLALGRQEEAAGAYRSMLPLDPSFVPGEDISPRTRDFFARVRADWEAAGRPGSPPPPPIAIRHRSPPRADRGQPVRLSAQIDDPGQRVDRMVLAYRQGSQAVFRRLDTRVVEGSYVATIPGGDIAPPLVEYYFEALDAEGLPIAARGDVAAPLRITVPAPSENVLEAWWFWTIIGGVALVGIVTAIAVGVAVSGQTGTLIVTVE
jgi:tetratricopeptide (TPR) repeat protein